MSIGANTRRLRIGAGFTQAALAAKIGIGTSMLSQIERGTKTLTLPLAAEVARVLDCSIYDLLDEEVSKCKTA